MTTYINGKIDTGTNYKKVQEALFTMGYSWWGEPKSDTVKDNRYLYLYEDGSITYSEGTAYFDNHKFPVVEITSEVITNTIHGLQIVEEPVLYVQAGDYTLADLGRLTKQLKAL